MTRTPITLDGKGRCCGRKPLVYKRTALRLFCCRCDRASDPQTRAQVPNWAWLKDAGGNFRRAQA